jgi:sialic acid synthase SpsE
MTRSNKYPYLVAEVGSNHLGSDKLIKKSILLAKKSGADCVKFQLFDENNLVNKNIKIFKHVSDKKLKFQYQRFKKVKISVSQIIKYYKFSKKIGIDFSVTPFDPSYVKKIKRYTTFFKIASGDINYIPLLKEIAKTNKKVVISTGMSKEKEIKKALSIFKNKNKITLLHCISSYPTNIESSNLINIINLKKKYKVDIGYSDHAPGTIVAANSVLFGAKMIEKHFMPVKTKLAGDYKLSIGANEMKKLSEQIKFNFETIGKKRVDLYKSEKSFFKQLRRSIYYNKNLEKNHILKKNDIIFIRPFNKHGIEIENYKKIIGKKLKFSVRKNQITKTKDIKNL